MSKPDTTKTFVDKYEDEIKKYFTNVVEGFKTGGVWGGLGAMLTGYFDMMVMKPLDLLKDLVAWAADLFGFENASKWLGTALDYANEITHIDAVKNLDADLQKTL